MREKAQKSLTVMKHPQSLSFCMTSGWTVAVLAFTLLLIVSDAGIVMGQGGRAPRSSSPLEPRLLAPDWSMVGLDGKMYNLEALRGRIVVINFWGSWCPPCRVELPHYQKFFRRYRNDESLVILSINTELSPDPKKRLSLARNFALKYNLTFPVLPDMRGKVSKAYRVSSYPTIYVVDKDGFIRKRLEGYYAGVMEDLQQVVEYLKHESRGNTAPKKAK